MPDNPCAAPNDFSEKNLSKAAEHFLWITPIAPRYAAGKQLLWNAVRQGGEVRQSAIDAMNVKHEKCMSDCNDPNKIPLGDNAENITQLNTRKAYFDTHVTQCEAAEATALSTANADRETCCRRRR